MRNFISLPVYFVAAERHRVSALLLLTLILVATTSTQLTRNPLSTASSERAGERTLAQLSPAGLQGRAAEAACQPPSTSLKPKNVAALYGFDQLWAQGIRGSGETVYLVEIDAFQPSDIQNYFSCVGVSANQLAITTVGTPPQRVMGEATLDIEMVAGLARQANIVDVQTDGNAPGDLWQHINACLQSILVQASGAGAGDSVVSISLGQPENQVPQADRQAIDTSLASLSREGVPVFVASGDSGAAAVTASSPPSTSFPASDSWVTSVGGTKFVPVPSGGRADDLGNHFAEVGWSGSGGGTSALFARPLYQQAPGLSPSVATRQVPDVSAVASNLALYLQGSWITAGGTSAAAPLWSAAVALIEQATLNRPAGRLFFPQILYSLAASTPGAYFDITQGANPLPAGPGWDPVTGLGTPNLPGLVQAIQASA